MPSPVQGQACGAIHAEVIPRRIWISADAKLSLEPVVHIKLVLEAEEKRSFRKKNATRRALDSLRGFAVARS